MPSMSKPRSKSVFDEKIPHEHICDSEDCYDAGEFRAPKSRLIDRGARDDYYWFCLKHIREFNKSWNFFDGMSDHEVLRYKDEDITGHRPTWKLGTRTGGAPREFRYDDPFDFQKETGANQNSDNHNGRTNSKDMSNLDTEERDALATLNLVAGSSLKDIKKRHKELAKKYHPDTRGGDKQAEEILKTINQAYTHLLSCANS
ncbi:MAG: J domain-containing protein [Sneathiella sp.]|nr:J domain-containing protein [Sneathiella sp.]